MAAVFGVTAEERRYWKMSPRLVSTTSRTMTASSTVRAKPTTPVHSACVVPRVANTGMVRIRLLPRKMMRQIVRRQQRRTR